MAVKVESLGREKRDKRCATLAVPALLDLPFGFKPELEIASRRSANALPTFARACLNLWLTYHLRLLLT